MDENLKKTVVLVVDDDENVLRSIVRHLNKRDGYAVFAANDVFSAEEILARENVQLLVCDYNLGPGAPSGVELISRWRQTYSGISRAVILTGSEMSEIPDKQEVDAILSKSSNLNEVLTNL